MHQHYTFPKCSSPVNLEIGYSEFSWSCTTSKALATSTQSLFWGQDWIFCNSHSTQPLVKGHPQFTAVMGVVLMVHSLCLISADSKSHQITSSFLSFLPANLCLITIQPLEARLLSLHCPALPQREQKKIISIYMLSFQEKPPSREI